ncbi:putative mannosyltransferase [Xenorhabdus stockiae]|uniref:Putative mannosyltransferase n=1 Tax=Xenorhabdus stockiae TaxID=351614 RepID=A0A2D0KSB8_9GAMM|nr:glycosyltransferase family 1 protein [Xenorhabdus stockiae]PHM66215.1 putative mannosyltransferase [Xenorhabdus stockiae]
MNVFINTRILNGTVTGVQRYLSSILGQIGKENFTCIRPHAPMAGVKGHLWEQLYLPFNLSKLKTKNDVLWSPSNTGPLYTPCRHIVTIHDLASIEYPEWTTRSFSTLYRIITPQIVKNCDSIIAVSEYTKNRLLDLYKLPSSKIHVIHNGIDEKFSVIEDKSNLSYLYQKYSLPSGKLILTISSIEPRKNISRLLSAWEKISSSLNDTHLIIAGARNDRIFKDAGILNIPDRVHFTGYIDDIDIVNLYNCATAFIYVPLYEGFGLPPLEAMACGLPVITSNVSSLPEVVGNAAMLVNPFNTNDIANAMIEIIQNNQHSKTLSQMSVIQATKFSWNKTAKETYNLLINV